jgi:hypothetical protein
MYFRSHLKPTAAYTESPWKIVQHGECLGSRYHTDYFGLSNKSIWYYA